MNFKTLFSGVVMLCCTSLFGQHSPGDSTFVDDVEAPFNQEVQLFAPNAFTPDGDLFNDTWKFYIEGIDIYDFHLIVFDRAGQIVWESYDPSAEWDGNFGNVPAGNGIYGYVIQAGDAQTDQIHEFKGLITILR